MSGWVLDTNIVSELARPSPNPGVVTFLAKLDRLLLPAVVVYELELGVQRLPAGRRRAALESWLAEFLGAEGCAFAPLDREAAAAAARVEAGARRSGRPIDSRDALIVGTAIARQAGIATRNVAHLGGHGVRTTNPFT